MKKPVSIRNKAWVSLYQICVIGTFLIACGSEPAGARQQPVLQPFPQPPPAPTLSAEERSTVEKGEPVYKNFDDGDGAGRALAVFRVNASRETIWKTIKQFDKYNDWVPNVKSATVYSKANDPNLLVEFKVKAMFMTYTYFIKHYYPADGSTRNWGTWTLDYDKKSEINDSVGFWSVEPVAGKTNLCDVTYSVGISVGGFADILKDMLEDSGVRDATAWLKKQAEAR